MRKYIGYGVLVLGMCALSAPALADEDEGFYVGVSAGSSEFTDFDKGNLDGVFADSLAIAGLLPGAISSSVDDKDTAFSFFGGYRLLPYLAVEIGYTDLGKATYRGSTTTTGFGTGPLAASTTIDFESKGVMASAVGTYPFSDVFDVHGRLGLFFSDTELRVGVNLRDDVSAGRFTLNRSDSAADGFFSVGAGLTLATYWHVSLDYQVFGDVGDDNTGEMNVETVSLSVAYRL